MSGVNSYQDLKVWRVGVRISLEIYKHTSTFPAEEKYGLTSQLRRCSVSLPSNIAEGHARDSTRDYLRHLSIAAGSLAELETQIVIATELGFLPTEKRDQLLELCDEESRMLSGLQRSLKAKLNAS